MDSDAKNLALPDLRLSTPPRAIRMPAEKVAVTEDGKTFHRADCPFIHGPIKMVDAKAAAAEDYVPGPPLHARGAR
ncbi:MAG: hypothetical protein ACXVY9_03055 [Terriglobales bacterium]